MKRRWKIILALVTLAGICALLVLSTANRAERELEATRRSLRQQGFKLDLAEFNFSTSPELRARAAMLATTTMAEIRNRARPPRPRVLTDVPPLMAPAGTDSALVFWKLQRLRSYRSPDLWPELRESLNADRQRLDAARQAAISGPIRFEP